MSADPKARPWTSGGKISMIFLIALGLGALGIALNFLFVPMALQADSDAALAGKEYLEQLANFERNPLLIRFHVAVGTLFVVIAALQFWRSFRNKDLRRHRWIGYAGLGCLVTLPLTGLAATFVYPFTGWAGVWPNLVWTVAIVFCVWKAWTAIRRRDVIDHEAWVTRATAMTLGITLSRVYEPLLFHFLHVSPRLAMAIVFWLGQGEGLVAAEFWLRRPGSPQTRRRQVKAAKAKTQGKDKSETEPA